MSTSQDKGSQIATLEFGHRFVILNMETKEFVSGKEYSYGPGGTRVMWSKDPKRARLFKAERHAKNCAGYSTECCEILKVSIRAD